MRLLVVILALCIANPKLLSAAQNALVIKNESLEATFNPANGTLSLRSLATRNVFIPASSLVVGFDKTRLVRVSDPVFGAGQGIEVVSPNSRKDEIMLYPGLPFVLLRRSITNPGSTPLEISREETFQATVDLGRPAAELSVIGSGGFQKGNQAVGSLAWIAVAQPHSRLGVVAGWLTHDHASGVLFSHQQDNKVGLIARSDFGALRIGPRDTKVMDTLAIGCFADARIGLETWAGAVATVYRINLPPILTGYCTWYHAGASNEKDLVRDAAIAAEKLKPYGLNFMQIDDGWQAGFSKNGPRKDFTKVRPDGPYKNGMKPVAEAITAQGLVAGIWFMPFSGNWDDPWFADKQDFWFKTKEGKPYQANWSGTLMDMTNPKARRYLREEVQRISGWGYRYFKMDGLHSGLGCIQTYASMSYKEDNFGDSVMFDPGRTQVEAYREGLKMVREVAAKGTFLLGCCAPQNMRSYGATFGLVDAMRIGPDNGGNWKGWLTSPAATTVHYFLNGRIWYNDPDPVYLRSSIPLTQVRAMCSWQALTGSLTVFSDSLAELPQQRIEILRRILPTHSATARPVDMLENDQRRIWLVTDTLTNQRRDVIGLFNWTADPIDGDYDVAYIGLNPEVKYAAYDFWSGDLLTFQGKLALPVEPTSCRILAVRPILDRPFLLSTSRHVTQGMVDVTEEKWNLRTGTLSGRSRIVAHDPYELRIAAVAPGADWVAESVSVGAADRAQGIKIELGKADRGLVRATIAAPASAEVSWSVRFKSGKTASPIVFGQE